MEKSNLFKVFVTPATAQGIAKKGASPVELLVPIHSISYFKLISGNEYEVIFAKDFVKTFHFTGAKTTITSSSNFGNVEII